MKVEKDLMPEKQHLYWTPCAAHRIDLMTKDIRQLSKVKCIVDNGQTVSKYMYSHIWVLILLKKYVQRELLRSGLTRFATNYIALKSLLDNKSGLRAIMTSDEWRASKYAKTNDG